MTGSVNQSVLKACSSRRLAGCLLRLVDVRRGSRIGLGIAFGLGLGLGLGTIISCGRDQGAEQSSQALSDQTSEIHEMAGATDIAADKTAENAAGTNADSNDVLRVSSHTSDERNGSIVKARTGTTLFTSKRDCKALVFNVNSYCESKDCRAVILTLPGLCQSEDCKAIVYLSISRCTTRDCKALILNNLGFCDSQNCKAILTNNYGLCR